MLVALALPPLLVHHMASVEYSAWVLILQCSAYINLLDLGLQTAVESLLRSMKLLATGSPVAGF